MCSLEHELILNVGEVLAQIDTLNLDGGGLDLGPSVHLKAAVFFHDVCVGVAHSDNGALLDHVELLIVSHHTHAAELVADDALGDSVHGSSVVSLALTNDLDACDLQVHVDSSAWLQLRHVDENRLAERWLCCCFYHWLFYRSVL